MYRKDFCFSKGALKSWILVGKGHIISYKKLNEFPDAV